MMRALPLIDSATQSWIAKAVVVAGFGADLAYGIYCAQTGNAAGVREAAIIAVGALLLVVGYYFRGETQKRRR